MARSSFAVRLHSAGAIVARAATVAVMLLWPSALFGQTWQVVEYYDTDAIGSIRVVTDAAGAVVARHDFLTFGEELNPQTPPHDKKLFTGQERDFETGQDYFGARYYRANLARFTTVDPGHVGGDVGDPQSWNAYAYARNNPLKYVDPDGRRWFTKNGNAVWADPNKDGNYASPGQGWAELDPANYPPWGVNVAFVNGNLSFIGETPSGEKILTPWFSDAPVEDATFSLASNLWLAASAVRAGAALLAGREAGASIGSRSLDPNKLNHIFGKALHNLGPLVARFGSQEAAYAAVERAAQAAVQGGGLSGTYRVTVNVGGMLVEVMGNVVNGVARVGTFYIR